MNEEEKNAVEIVKGLAVYYDDYSLLDEEEIKENESVNKSIELILNLIEKLLKENEQLNAEVNSLKKENEELNDINIAYAEYLVKILNEYKKESVPKQKVKDKIEELNKQLEEDLQDGIKVNSNRFIIICQCKSCLQELLESEE